MHIVFTAEPLAPQTVILLDFNCLKNKANYTCSSADHSCDECPNKEIQFAFYFVKVDFIKLVKVTKFVGICQAVDASQGGLSRIYKYFRILLASTFVYLNRNSVQTCPCLRPNHGPSHYPFSMLTIHKNKEGRVDRGRLAVVQTQT